MIKPDLIVAFIKLIVIFMNSSRKSHEKSYFITFEKLLSGTSGCWNGSDSSGGFISGNAFFPNTLKDWIKQT